MSVQYGVTPQGFVSKQQAQIQAEIQNQLQAALGQNINLLPRAVFGQIVGIFSEREALNWQLNEAVYNSRYPEGAEGDSVDNILALSGLKRLPATQTRTPNGGPLILGGVPGTFIPADSLVLVTGNTAAPPFKTVNAVTIAAAVDAVQNVIFTSVPDSGNFTLSINGHSTSSLPYTTTASSLQTALRLLTGYADVVVTGSFASGFTVTFAGTSGAQAQPLIVVVTTTLQTGLVVVNVSIANTTPGIQAQATTPAVCTQTGPVFASTGSLTTIGTPVTGWTTVTNPLDCITGTNIETDTEALTRRETLLATQGNGPLDSIVEKVSLVTDVTQAIGFENLGIFPDLAGRPAKCFEIVVNGGLDQDIAESIYGSKPAGIQPFGNTGPIQVFDPYGFEHDIYFSRPTLVPIYMTLKLTINSQFDKTLVQTIQKDLVTTGEELKIGGTVIVFGSNGLIGCFNSVPNITSYEFGIGTSPNPPLGQTDNIVVAAEELASFDTARIIISYA